MIGEIFGRLFASEGNRRDPLDNFWYDQIIVAANEQFTPDEAMQLSAVQDSLAALSDPVGTLPLHIFERDADGGRKRNDNHAVSRVLTGQANRINSACEFRSFMQQDLGWNKNALAEIILDERGEIEQLKPIAWRRVIDVQSDIDGSVLYRFTDKRGMTRVLRNDEVLHLRAAPFDDDCICGKPVYKTGRATLGLALAVHRYGRTFFANSGKSGGTIEFPGEFKDTEQRNKFLSAWKRGRTGPNAHSDRVIEHGGKYTVHTVNNDEAQFRETKNDASNAVGRLWRMPPHIIGNLERATNSNIEAQSIEFVQHTLLPWLIVWEQAIGRDLLFDDPFLFAEFDVGGLLRGDLKSRYEAYAKARQWGWMTVNEIRRRENLDPVDGGDVLLTPMNMTDDPSGAPPKDAATTEPKTDARAEVLEVLRESEEKKAA